MLGSPTPQDYASFQQGVRLSAPFRNGLCLVQNFTAGRFSKILHPGQNLCPQDTGFTWHQIPDPIPSDMKFICSSNAGFGDELFLQGSAPFPGVKTIETIIVASSLKFSACCSLKFLPHGPKLTLNTKLAVKKDLDQYDFY